MLIAVFSDIFRSHDLSGWGKALWSLLIIFLPYLGVFVYLIVRGHKMSEHAIADAKAQEAAFQQYVRQTAGSGGSTARRARAAGQAAPAGHPRRRRVRHAPRPSVLGYTVAAHRQAFGTWPSPVTSEVVVAAADMPTAIAVDGDDVWWSETRPGRGRPHGRAPAPG